MSTPNGERILIGWKEWIAFPEWGILKAKAKIDSGAKTSALNGRVEMLRSGLHGETIAVLSLALSWRKPHRRTSIETPIVRIAKVRDTSGEMEERVVVETLVRLGSITKKVRFTIADRSRLLTPIILGRQALEGHFLVDVEHKYLLRM